MISTVVDFAKFSQMLLNGGSLDGRQYLSPRAFDEMAADHIGPRSGIARDYFCFPGDGFGYGLGLAVRTDPGNATPGRIEMGRRQRLLFYHRPQAGHVLHPDAADAVVTPAHRLMARDMICPGEDVRS